MSKSMGSTGDPRRLTGFERFAGRATRVAGSSAAFGVACASVVAWSLTGPYFNFSDTWQIVINTATTIVTFLMVFLIQQSQKKERIAIQLKLNELIASHEQASNRLVAIEDFSDAELEVVHKFYRRLAELAAEEGGVKRSHSLDEADRGHARKLRKG